MGNRKNVNKGFSLIELLIAITLLSIILIMVTQFMSTTSWAVTRTQKNQNIQTEAMEVGGKISDSFMQATYVRVRAAAGGDVYDLDADMDQWQKDRNAGAAVDNLIGDLVVDNYPNYLKAGVTDRQIILNEADYTFLDINDYTYPLADDYDQTNVQSFRVLTKERATNPSAKSLYVKPEYIYIQYQKKATVAGASTDAYVIYYFTGRDIYMARGDLLAGADGFNAAVGQVNANVAASEGLLSSNVSDCYFSADTEANTLFIDMLFENERYEGYTYNYVDSVVLRNTNVLTVPPQKMYKKK